jgi:hypothetical protein
MKFQIGLASCMILLVVGAMQVPASSSVGSDMGKIATVSASYGNGWETIELYSDGTAVVRTVGWRDAPLLHGRYVLKGNELTITFKNSGVSCGRSKDGKVDFGICWSSTSSLQGAYTKK